MMRHAPTATDRAAAAFRDQLFAAARGRARTAAHLRVRGPGALPRTLAMSLGTAVVALALIRLF
jgi:hypothetical protein